MSTSSRNLALAVWLLTLMGCGWISTEAPPLFPKVPRWPQPPKTPPVSARDRAGVTIGRPSFDLPPDP